MVRNSTIVVCGTVFIGVIVVMLGIITHKPVMLGVAFMVFFAGLGLASGVYDAERRIERERRNKNFEKKDH